MKKLVLLFAVSLSAFAANAQLVLGGASPYVQNFNAIGSGLPTGWSVYNSSTATSLGSLNSLIQSPLHGIYDTANTDCIGLVLGAGFKNYPSANVAMATDTCGTQVAYTDRALGVRQTSGTASGGVGLDSGAAFVLHLANTTGMHNVKVAFKLMSLDVTSPRTTHWQVDYGTGAVPSMFNVATMAGTYTTGGNVWASHLDTASFGTSLDNLSSDVWIRVVTLVFSSGSGNRGSSAIDDYTIMWTGTAGVADLNTAGNSSLVVFGDATSDHVSLGYDVEEGAHQLTVSDLSGRTVYTQTVNATGVAGEVSLNGLHLAPGMYIAKIANGKTQAVTKMMVH